MRRSQNTSPEQAVSCQVYSKSLEAIAFAQCLCPWQTPQLPHVKSRSSANGFKAKKNTIDFVLKKLHVHANTNTTIEMYSGTEKRSVPQNLNDWNFDRINR